MQEMFVPLFLVNQKWAAMASYGPRWMRPAVEISYVVFGFVLAEPISIGTQRNPHKCMLSDSPIKNNQPWRAKV